MAVAMAARKAVGKAGCLVYLKVVSMAKRKADM